MANTRSVFEGTVLHEINIEALRSFTTVFYLGNAQLKQKQLLSIGSLKTVQTYKKDAFKKLNSFRKEINDWAFGWINYDVKNELENLSSLNPMQFNNPLMYFAQPKIVFEIEGKNIKCHYFEEHHSEEDIIQLTEQIWSDQKARATTIPSIQFEPTLTKSNYIKQVESLKRHIRRGDIYEANFCQIFKANGSINPYQSYETLIRSSPTPFSAFVQLDNYFTLCASPERFVKKEGNKITSQPIKGTIERGATQKEDLEKKVQLQKSKKDQTENVMIVDLVRNDLSKVAAKGTVTVDELFGIYSFEQVHQMISTISCQIADNQDGVSAIEALFPIASMTGVPKIRAMELIEEHEDFQRELYSGCIGYFTPSHDFDFNVVIRSLFYNSTSRSLSYAAGGAIIDASDPEAEYDESILKAKAITNLFSD